MKKQKRAVAFLKQKSYLLAAVLMLAAVFGMTGVYMAEEKAEKQQAKQEEQERLAALEEQRRQEAEEVDQLIPPVNDDFLDTPEVVSDQDKADAGDEDGTAGADTDQAASTGKAERVLHFDAATDMKWPLQGNVIMNYSMDQTIYFATLDQYKYNPAIVIQGKVNDKVLSVAEGRVTHIETNEVTGITLTMDLGDGYSAVYGQLKEVELKAGDYVKAGGTLGYVSQPTKYYSVEGPNLYFQMIKDNVSIDPMEFLQ